MGAPSAVSRQPSAFMMNQETGKYKIQCIELSIKKLKTLDPDDIDARKFILKNIEYLLNDLEEWVDLAIFCL